MRSFTTFFTHFTPCVGILLHNFIDSLYHCRARAIAPDGIPHSMEQEVSWGGTLGQGVSITILDDSLLPSPFPELVHHKFRIGPDTRSSHGRSRELELRGLLPSHAQACATLWSSVLLIEYLHAKMFCWQLIANGCVRAIVSLACYFVRRGGCLLMQLLTSRRAWRVFPTLSESDAAQSCSMHGLTINSRTTK